MMIHVAFTTYNYAGVRLTANVFFYHITGLAARASLPGYAAPDGNLTVWSEFMPPYQTSTWTDFKLFIPYVAFPRSPGLLQYYCYMYIMSQGVPLCKTDNMYFNVGSNGP